MTEPREPEHTGEEATGWGEEDWDDSVAEQFGLLNQTQLPDTWSTLSGFSPESIGGVEVLGTNRRRPLAWLAAAAALVVVAIGSITWIGGGNQNDDAAAVDPVQTATPVSGSSPETQPECTNTADLAAYLQQRMPLQPSAVLDGPEALAQTSVAAVRGNIVATQNHPLSGVGGTAVTIEILQASIMEGSELGGRNRVNVWLPAMDVPVGPLAGQIVVFLTGEKMPDFTEEPRESPSWIAVRGGVWVACTNSEAATPVNGAVEGRAWDEALAGDGLTLDGLWSYTRNEIVAADECVSSAELAATLRGQQPEYELDEGWASASPADLFQRSAGMLRGTFVMVTKSDGTTEVTFKLRDVKFPGLESSVTVDRLSYSAAEVPIGLLQGSFVAALSGPDGQPSGAPLLDGFWVACNDVDPAESILLTPRGPAWNELLDQGMGLDDLWNEVAGPPTDPAFQFSDPATNTGVRGVGPDGIEGIDLTTGEARWARTLPNSILVLHGTLGIGGKGVLVEVQGQELTSLDYGTGEQLWSIPLTLGEGSLGLSGHAEVDGQEIWMLRTSKVGEGNANPPALRRFDANTGEVLWSAEGREGTEWQLGQPVVFEGVVVLMDVVEPWFAEGSAALHAFDVETGELRWTVDLETTTYEYREDERVAVFDFESGRILVALTPEGWLYRIDPQTGEVLWSRGGYSNGSFGGTDLTRDGVLALEVLVGEGSRLLFDPQNGDLLEG